MFTIEMLHANEGDALWIEYGPKDGPVRRILVDAGRQTAGEEILRRVKTLSPDEIESQDESPPPSLFELFIMTHVDDDHIYGGLELLLKKEFYPTITKDLWFNGLADLEEAHGDTLGAKNGAFFEALIIERNFPWNAAFDRKAVRVPANGPLKSTTLEGGLKLTVLSPDAKRMKEMAQAWRNVLDAEKGDDDYIEPGDWRRALEVLRETKKVPSDLLGDWHDKWAPDKVQEFAAEKYVEDTTAPNGSSIAVMAEYDGMRVLLTGDAFPTVLETSLEKYADEHGLQLPLEIHAFKLSHHGSQKNLSPKLLRLIDCKKFLISTNGSRYHHPHPAAVSRIITTHPGAELYFNYRSDESLVWDDDAILERDQYSLHYDEIVVLAG